jgi:toxin FitB
VILVDTNVISEPLMARGDSRVVAWLDRQPADTLFISTISVSEILFGVAALAAGKRRNRLAAAFEPRSSACLRAAYCPSILRPRAHTLR